MTRLARAGTREAMLSDTVKFARAAGLSQHRYAADARLKLDLINDHLAGKEMEVGRFYQRRADWLASVIKKVNLPNCGTLPDFGNFRVSND